jgi:AraC-like DNA-binding protein
MLITTGLPVTQIAQEVGYHNVRAFAESFKDHTGENAASFRTRVRVWRAQRYFRRTDLSIDKVATLLSMNGRSHLASIFKRYTEETPGQYKERMDGPEKPTDERLLKSKRMLINTDLTLQRISERLRYTSKQAFLKSFKYNFGETAGQYRERMRNVSNQPNPKVT